MVPFLEIGNLGEDQIRGAFGVVQILFKTVGFGCL